MKRQQSAAKPEMVIHRAPVGSSSIGVVTDALSVAGIAHEAREYDAISGVKRPRPAGRYVMVVCECGPNGRAVEASEIVRKLRRRD